MNKTHKTILKWWDSLTFDERIEKIDAAVSAGHENPCMLEAWEVKERSARIARWIMKGRFAVKRHEGTTKYMDCFCLWITNNAPENLWDAIIKGFDVKSAG